MRLAFLSFFLLAGRSTKTAVTASCLLWSSLALGQQPPAPTTEQPTGANAADSVPTDADPTSQSARATADPAQSENVEAVGEDQSVADDNQETDAGDEEVERTSNEETPQDAKAEQADAEAPQPAPEDTNGSADAQPTPTVAAPPEKGIDYRVMFLVEGVGKYGAFTRAQPGSSLENAAPEVDGQGAGHAGGQLTMGFMPGGSPFMMAGRLGGGSYLGRGVTRGSVAALLLFGANLNRNERGNEFTHLLGGVGVEYLPGENQDLVTLSASGGIVVQGLALGGQLLLAANDEVAVLMLGMQIGWGQLY